MPLFKIDKGANCLEISGTIFYLGFITYNYFSQTHIFLLNLAFPLLFTLQYSDISSPAWLIKPVISEVDIITILLAIDAVEAMMCNSLVSSVELNIL